MIGIILFDIEKANSRMRLSPILERDVGRNYAAGIEENIRILETKMYQELLISGLIIPFYFVCEMCEVFQLNQVQSGMIRSNEN